MKKQIKKIKEKIDLQLSRRIKITLVVFSIFTLTIITATYAWFISLRHVNIHSFDLKIDTNLNLLLSLDGKSWDNVVYIDRYSYNDTSNVYKGNTNAWSEVGLIPVSTDGSIDITSSRLNLYQKVGMSTTSGGFRLLASKINNRGPYEGPGYIAFDLFIKNFSKKLYTEEIDYLTEEPIYLGSGSFVKVADQALSNRGIENSVRIAFAHIGRVIGTTNDQQMITSISCNDDGSGNPSVVDGKTGICKPAIIWEPNDRNHVDGLIYWYKESCLSRIGYDINLSSTYAGACKPIKNGVSYPTYAIIKEIVEKSNVDVYDGKAYNGYMGSDSFLKEVKNYTDTDKEKSGLEKKEIFTLAPNSITKVRVYIYLEGQDIDNFEYAQDAKRILIDFNFTKDRFSAEELDGENWTDLDDIWKPSLKINENIKEIVIKRGEELVYPKATATDKIGEKDDRDIIEDISDRIQIISNVDTSVPGEYEIIYRVSDWSNNFSDPISIKIIVT